MRFRRRRLIRLRMVWGGAAAAGVAIDEWKTVVGFSWCWFASAMLR